MGRLRRHSERKHHFIPPSSACTLEVVRVKGHHERLEPACREDLERVPTTPSRFGCGIHLP